MQNRYIKYFYRYFNAILTGINKTLLLLALSWDVIEKSEEGHIMKQSRKWYKYPQLPIIRNKYGVMNSGRMQFDDTRYQISY